MQHCTMEQFNQEDELLEIADKLEENLNLVDDKEENEDEDEDEEEEEEEFEFSFLGDDLESPVSAEEAFHNGQIRPVFPLFGENVEISGVSPTGAYASPVRKVFVAASEDDNVAEGPYCEWSTEKSTPENSSPAPEMSRKSYSTGFSRLWRMKDLLARSNSDGKDTFVFLTRKGTKTTTTTMLKKEVAADVAVESKKKGKKPTKTAAGAAYEALYGKKKGGAKPYMSYRQDLVGGFFTNVNGMTRNIHPY